MRISLETVNTEIDRHNNFNRRGSQEERALHSINRIDRSAIDTLHILKEVMNHFGVGSINFSAEEKWVSMEDFSFLHYTEMCGVIILCEKHSKEVTVIKYKQ